MSGLFQDNPQAGMPARGIQLLEGFDIRAALEAHALRPPEVPQLAHEAWIPGAVLQDALHGFACIEDEEPEDYPEWPPPSDPVSPGPLEDGPKKPNKRTARRKRNNQLLQEQGVVRGQKFRQWTSRRNSSLPELDINVPISGFVPCRGAYRALDIPALKSVKPMRDLLPRLNVVNWNGIDPEWMTDPSGKIVAVMAGRPSGPKWLSEVHKNAATAMMTAANRIRGGADNRRGNYRSVSVGLSHGGGQERPAMLAVEPGPTQDAVNELLQDEAIVQMVRFAASAFGLHAPNLYDEYKRTMGRIYDNDPENLYQVLPSVFPAFTFNLGPRTVTFEHYDSRNKPNGWIAVTALGNYDADKGGHLIFREFGLMVRFPPGSTILFPSAIIRHGNAPIQKGEFRMSITSYAAGALFQWVDYGFQLKEVARIRTPELYQRMEEGLDSAWARAVEAYSRPETILADRQAKLFTKKT